MNWEWEHPWPRVKESLHRELTECIENWEGPAPASVVELGLAAGRAVDPGDQKAA